MTNRDQRTEWNFVDSVFGYKCTGYPKILKDLVTLGLQSRMLS